MDSMHGLPQDKVAHEQRRVAAAEAAQGDVHLQVCGWCGAVGVGVRLRAMLLRTGW